MTMQRRNLLIAGATIGAGHAKHRWAPKEASRETPPLAILCA
jgi:hypothetical protein